MASELERKLEAILFVAGQTVTLTRLAKLASATPSQTAKALGELKKSLAGRGLTLLQSGDRYQLVTDPQMSEAVEAYLGQQVRSELSPAALETLAIIAYRQPTTKSQIDQIRGVSSEQTLRNLLQRGLIAEAGNSPSPGQPKLYATTATFLQQLGLSDPTDLPPIETEGGREA